MPTFRYHELILGLVLSAAAGYCCQHPGYLLLALALFALALHFLAARRASALRLQQMRTVGAVASMFFEADPAAMSRLARALEDAEEREEEFHG